MKESSVIKDSLITLFDEVLPASNIQNKKRMHSTFQMIKGRKEILSICNNND